MEKFIRTTEDWFQVKTLAVWIIVVLLIPRVSTSIPPGCDGLVDLSFVIDSSESIKENTPTGRTLENWELFKKFMINVTEGLPVGQSGARVAAIKFSNEAEVAFHLNYHKNKASLKTAINGLEFTGGNTNTASALRLLRNSVFQYSNGDRGHARNVAVIITDGLSNKESLRTIPEATLAKTRSPATTIFTIAIGKYMNEQELRDIASTPIREHFLWVYDFKYLNTILTSLLYRICRVTEPTPPPNLCIKDCIRCYDKKLCHQCTPGKYFDGEKCASCVADCDECYDSTTCVTCKLGWFWNKDKCTRCEVKADLSFVIDNSGSIRDKNPADKSYDNYQLLKNFIKSLLDKFDIGYNRTRVGIVKFSNDAHIVMQLDESFEREKIKQKVQNIGYTGGATNTAAGLRTMWEKIYQTTRGDRPDIRDVAIVITDGESTVDSNLTIPMASRIKSKNVRIYGVGVTDSINEKELKGIASDPDEEHYFNSTDLRQLDGILKKLIKHLCSPHNPDMTGRPPIYTGPNPPNPQGKGEKDVSTSRSTTGSTNSAHTHRPSLSIWTACVVILSTMASKLFVETSWQSPCWS